MSKKAKGSSGGASSSASSPDAVTTKTLSEAFVAAFHTGGAHYNYATLPDGCCFSLIKAGSGLASPSVSDVCTIRYRGELMSGVVFDETKVGSKPLSIKPSECIAGWHQVLTIMTPGDQVHVVVPWQLAYGEAGSPPRIPPYSALSFYITLVDFEGSPTEQQDAEPHARMIAAGGVVEEEYPCDPKAIATQSQSDAVLERIAAEATEGTVWFRFHDVVLPDTVFARVVKKGTGKKCPAWGEAAEVITQISLAGDGSVVQKAPAKPVRTLLQYPIGGSEDIVNKLFPYTLVSRVLCKMVEGDVWEVVVGYQSAFGVKGVAPPLVPPYACLCFIVTMVKLCGPGKDVATARGDTVVLEPVM
eukprot:PhM_4_TR1674/c0_g1_i1/m.2251